MTRRPGVILIISMWLGFYFLVFISAPVTKALSASLPSYDIRIPLVVAWLILIITFSVRLAQLRALYIWVSIIVGGASTLWILLGITVLAQPGLYSHPIAVVSGTVIVVLNSASIWYLASPRFRKLARQYRLEQDQSEVVRRAERALRKPVAK